MRQRSLSPECMRQQKLAKEATTRSSRSQHQEVTTTLPAPQPSSSMVKHQATVTAVPQYPTPDELTRKRDIVPAWLDRQAQRFRSSWHSQSEHRDSMFDGVDGGSKPVFEDDLRRASREANAVVLDFHGKPVPQHVIDHFFGEHPAGGSDWRNSAQWEEHLADYFPWKATQTSPQKSLSPFETFKNRDSYFSLLVWRTRSSKQRQKRGKFPEETASDELDGYANSPFDKPLSPQTSLPELLPDRSLKFRRPKAGIVIWDDTAQCTQVPSSARCTLVSKPVDPPPIPISQVSDVEPAQSGGSDMNNAFHTTDCPHDTSPRDLSRFPLARNSVTQSAPQLRPEECIVSVSESEQILSSLLYLPGSRVPPDDSLLFKIPPLLSAGPSATNVQRWPSQHPSALHNATAPRREDNNAHIIADVLSQNEGLEMSAMRKRSTPAVTATHHILAPDPAMQFPLTPPDSRQASNASCSELTKHVPARKESVGRDWSTCKLSDTTGSSLPDCGVFIGLDDLKKSHKEWWAGNTERYGFGMWSVDRSDGEKRRLE